MKSGSVFWFLEHSSFHSYTVSCSCSGVPCSCLHDVPFSPFPCSHSSKIHSKQDFYKQPCPEPADWGVCPAHSHSREPVYRSGRALNHSITNFGPCLLSHCTENPLRICIFCWGIAGKANSDSGVSWRNSIWGLTQHGLHWEKIFPSG